MQSKEFSIGRADTNTIVINDPQISKFHAKLMISAENIATIIDLESTNGTFVNEIQIQKKQLKRGDRVALGNYLFEWENFLNEPTFVDSSPKTKSKKGNKTVGVILFFAILVSIFFFIIQNTDWFGPKKDNTVYAQWDLKNDTLSYSVNCLKDSSRGGEIVAFAKELKNQIFNANAFEVTHQEEVEVGREIKRQLDQTSVYNNSLQYKGRIDVIMNKLLEPLPFRKFNYQWFVIESEEINAFTAGGYIFIMTGIIDFAESDDELACVIGHEIFHNELGHIQEKIREIKFFQAKAGIAANIVLMAKSMLTEAFNQENEVYCDMYGLDLAVFAGYDGCAGMKFWNRMSLKEEVPTLAGQLMRSHPYSRDRVRCTQQHINRNYHATCQ